MYNTLNGIYNAQGDSKTPLIFLMISSLTNIVLDLLFVIQFNMGVAGVAWATLIAQGMCAIAYALVYLTPFGANAIWWSIPAGWAVGAAVSLLRVKSGKWMRTAVADR